MTVAHIVKAARVHALKEELDPKERPVYDSYNEGETLEGDYVNIDRLVELDAIVEEGSDEEAPDQEELLHPEPQESKPPSEQDAGEGDSDAPTVSSAAKKPEAQASSSSSK